MADLEQWDAHFPDHPLTLVRAALRRVTPTVTLDEQFKAQPPFAGPNPPHSVAGHRPWRRRNPHLVGRCGAVKHERIR
ncbi:hypothetical protein [Streptomyces sp. NBC_01506]|uniref:hypothetical protein n=1 Tax=Streptomyces sp. NBC_01506 TaxID=2903887 RepID=UPI00386B1D88